MIPLLERFQDRPLLPIWVLPLCAVGVCALFVVSLPVGFDRTPDIILEGLYLAVALLVVVPLRRLGSLLLDGGWQIFVLGRFVDFLDELFVEPEPLVEPYVSGFLMVVSLSIIVAGSYSVVMQRDQQITELQDRTEELALKNSVIDEAPIGITVADMSRDDEPLISVNQAFTEITGYEATETLGRNCRFLQGEDTDTEKIDEMRRAIEHSESVQVTLRNHRKDGTLFWNEITLAPLSTTGDDVRHYAGFQQDATDRKQFEQALKSQRDDLDVLNQMLQHDIRNKLQLVTAHAEFLDEDVSEDGQDHLDMIGTAATEAIELTNTARNLSQAMQDSAPNHQPISLSEVLRSEIDDAAGADDVSVHVVSDIPEVFVEADEMLNSVFRNLLGNAIQHNDKARPEVTVSTTESEQFVTVTIADNGPGVPDELKDGIFARGEKGLESDGTGIGTYLIDTLVTGYGGEVWVEDNDPEGAIFAVKLRKAERNR